MSIQASGLCCAVGYSLPAAACALRAHMDHFQESHFVTPGGSPIIVARLPNDDLWGQERLGRWLELAIRDCMRHVPEIDVANVPLLWLAPEDDRAGTDAMGYDEAFGIAAARLQIRVHANSGVLRFGRAGLSQALLHAVRLFKQNPAPRHVLLAGVDSYLNGATINHYLSEDRLNVPTNPAGFIPGEAAAAVLLKVVPRRSAGVHVAGIGEAEEAGRPDGSVPSRAQGLASAMRVALAAAKLEYVDLAFRCSDQNGEPFFAREASNALTRVATVGAGKLAHLTLADSLGEVGAATGIAMLAYLHHVMPRQDGPGVCGLLHLANDDGRRCAVVMQYIRPERAA